MFNAQRKILNHLMPAGWMRWALLESVVRSLFKVSQRYIGAASGTILYAFFASFIVGITQALWGLMTAIFFGNRLIAGKRAITLSCFFGACSFVSVAGNFLVFLFGGDMGVNTFIVTLGIFLGAVVDKVRFKRKFLPMTKLAIVLAVVAGYIILIWPWPFRSNNLHFLDWWVAISFLVMLSTTANQWLSQEVKEMDACVKNFWGGITTTFIATAVLMASDLSFLGARFLDVNADNPGKELTLFLAAIVTGSIVFWMWQTDLQSHRLGATIAKKKIVVNGGYLILVTVAGLIFFHETRTIAKLVGLLIYLPTFALIEIGARKKEKKQAPSSGILKFV